MRSVVQPWAAQLGAVELGVEEVPLVPASWQDSSVPLSAFATAADQTPARMVLYRRPLEHRAESAADLETLLLTVVVEQIAEVLGIPAEQVHPGYEPE